MCPELVNTEKVKVSELQDCKDCQLRIDWHDCAKQASQHDDLNCVDQTPKVLNQESESKT